MINHSLSHSHHIGQKKENTGIGTEEWKNHAAQLGIEPSGYADNQAITRHLLTSPTNQLITITNVSAALLGHCHAAVYS